MVAINRVFSRPDGDTLRWCRLHVQTIKDGGLWCIPRSKTVFRVNHSKKQLELVEAGDDNDADYLATQHNFSFIGWDVVDCTTQGQNDDEVEG